MIDSFSHISNKNSFTIHLARYCGLPLATYCKIPHTRSDVRCKLKRFKKFDVSAFETFISLEFMLSTVVVWPEPGVQNRALARNVRI